MEQGYLISFELSIAPMKRKTSKDETPRLYENNLLEALSKSPVWLTILIYSIVIGYFSVSGFSKVGAEWPIATLVALGGIVFWTFTEYLLHRFVFHYKPKSKAGERFIFVIHGVHHDFPNDLNRLVFPVSVSIPLSIFFFFLFKAIPWTNEGYHAIFFSFFMLGYLVYDLIHYASHAFNSDNKVFLRIKNHHMKHHFAESNTKFGVSSNLWDLIFRTIGVK